MSQPNAITCGRFVLDTVKLEDGVGQRGPNSTSATAFPPYTSI